MSTGSLQEIFFCLKKSFSFFFSPSSSSPLGSKQVRGESSGKSIFSLLLFCSTNQESSVGWLVTLLRKNFFCCGKFNDPAATPDGRMLAEERWRRRWWWFFFPRKEGKCGCVLAIHTEAKRKLILGADLWSKIKMNNVLGRGWVTLLCVCGEVFSLTRGVLHLVKVQISTTFLSPFPWVVFWELCER